MGGVGFHHGALHIGVIWKRNPISADQGTPDSSRIPLPHGRRDVGSSLAQ
jgi:hypothetical protein